jgi:carbamoyl-phosphate synthase small subunit
MRPAKNIAYLLLEDGKIFNGFSIGVKGISTGEICFNTGMSGYQEIFTDPSYYGQVVVMTNAHIGNYGTNDFEQESADFKISGLIVKNFSYYFSRKRSSGSLNDLLIKNKIVGISDVDTRSLVRYIRNKGAMNCVIVSDNTPTDIAVKILKSAPSMSGLSLSEKVSTSMMKTFVASDEKFKIAAIDYGIKKSIIDCLNERGCSVDLFPLNYNLNDVLSEKYHGYFISNGPGDPSAMKEHSSKLKGLIETGKPIFGICLGHQLICEAYGINTFKMFNGHRGINHPIKNLLTGKNEVTSQNHGFAVKYDDVSNHNEIKISHLHLNDNTVAGIKFKSKPVFSVQYHPEASPGPFDSRYLFDEFVDLLHKNS